VGVPRNLTEAKQLYLKALTLAGKNYARGAAPRLGLISMTLDGLLQPLFGPDTTWRAARTLQRWLKLRPDVLLRTPTEELTGELPAALAAAAAATQGLGEGAAPRADNADAAEGMARDPSQASPLPQGGSQQAAESASQHPRSLSAAVLYALQAATDYLGLGHADADNMAMAVLVCALVFVLWWRHRLITALNAQTNQQTQQQMQGQAQR